MVTCAFQADQISPLQCGTRPVQTGAHLCSNVLQQAALLHVLNACGMSAMPPSVRTV